MYGVDFPRFPCGYVLSGSFICVGQVVDEG